MSEVQVFVTRKIAAPISAARPPKTTENVAPHAAAVGAGSQIAEARSTVRHDEVDATHNGLAEKAEPFAG